MRPVRIVLFGAAGSGLGLLALLYAGMVGAAIAQFITSSGAPTLSASQNGPGAARSYSAVLEESDFAAQMRHTGKYFRCLNSRAGSTYVRQAPKASAGLIGKLGAPNLSIGQRNNRQRSIAGEGKTYRTVCVRLCDGYYFPISTSTSKSRFREDEAACRSKCGSATRLYVYPTRDGTPETMVDLRGRDYSAMKTAFLYRAKYNASCTCRPHPWAPEAQKAHRLYASKGWQQRAKRLAQLERRKARREARTAGWRQRKRYRRALREVFTPQGQPPQSAVGATAVAAVNALVPAGIAATRGKVRRRVVPGRIRSRAMGLGVKPPRAAKRRRYKSRRKRRWQGRVFGGFSN